MRPDRPTPLEWTGEPAPQEKRTMHTIPRLAIILALGALAVAVFGCAPATHNPAPMAVVSAPQAEAEPPDANPGSLFDPASADYLLADNRARRVGDVVMVNIVEEASSKLTADTTADRDSSINLGVSSMFGKEDTRLLPFGPSFGLKGDVGEDKTMVKANAATTFEGTGETKRESTVTATVAARVVKIMPNGLMQIEGSREVKVNEETQVLVVRGLIRSKDITPDNAILSSYVADAHIEYYGRGVLADKQRPGWLTRLLENIWPF